MSSVQDRAYLELVAHYERCLERHGDTHLGVDWPRAEDADVRYGIMLGLIRADSPRPARLLDFGCGAGHLLEYSRRNGISGLEYHGLDLSERFVALCRQKFPGVPFLVGDVLDAELELPNLITSS